MKSFFFKSKKTPSIFLSGLLALSVILTPISLITTPKIQKAHSAGDASSALQLLQLVQDAGTFIQTTLSAASAAVTAGSATSLVTKEYILDTIVWPLTNIVIKEMIRSTTQWVKSGFKGSPAFVTDLQGFLLDIADKVAGNFIYGSPLSALCSPFSLNIKLALDFQYKESSRGYVAQCRISSVIGNVDRFMQGDFMQGGWDGWYNVALTPANNPYGAMLEAQGGLYASISGAQGREIKLLEFGRGLLSVKDASGKVVTPGAVVETQLNDTLGLPAKRIAVADEINELVGALFSQIAQQALSGVGGLLGLNDSPAGGDGSYLDQVSSERTPTSFTNTSEGPLESAIANETKYLNFQKTIINIITDASTYKDRIYEDLSCDGTLTASLSNKLTSARRSASTTEATIASFTILQNEYAVLQDTQSSATSITVILDKYGATSIPDGQSKIMERYFERQTSGVIHSPGDLVNLELIAIPEIQKEIPPFTESIDRACSRGGNSNDNDSSD